MIRDHNYSGQVAPDVGGETEFTHCNFAQPAPVDGDGSWIGVRLWPGDDTPRTFTDCNLTNCEPPPGSTASGCLGAIVRTGVVVGTDSVVIDGQTIEEDLTAHVSYGRRNPDGSYTYHETPRVQPDRRGG